jgi:Na+/H+ antiporter NhaD/arsenite permease-like protein
LEATLKIIQTKNLAALSIISTIAIILFTLPPLLGKEISPSLLISALILVSVYVILSFEIIHRTSVALLGAIIIVSFLLVMDSIEPSTSFDFIINVIDFNTIGLLLGMMIIIAILADSGVFQWVGIKATKMSKGKLVEIAFDIV